ncbi:MAG: hypothetical protein K6G69_03215 [Lachnospiraceae bacterium]|nr:hypothetical protein [Lachnospiraceae bacterium]
MYKKDCNLKDCIDYMGRKTTSTSHICIKEHNDDYERELNESYVILWWKNFDENIAKKWVMEGHQVVNVDTNDEDAIEYGKYCGLIWRYFKTSQEKQQIIYENHVRFKEIAKDIKNAYGDISCVFGTGPSIESSWDYDFSKCVCVVCNSIVKNRELLDYIQPCFVTAGDVVSHLGVSKYAEVFRDDLFDYLNNSKAYFMTTATFGYLLLEHYPYMKNKIMIAEQGIDVQNFDLCNTYLLPRLDSVLNVLMLPIANTFGKTIIINGCDGKIPNKNNEDFWAHSESAQYLELVNTGHKCHPTFDINRQKKTYSRYNESVRLSMDMGENEYGKKYYTILPSFVEALKGREICNNTDLMRLISKER